MNEQLFLAINGLASKSHVLDVLGVFFAEKFLYVFAIIIVVLWFSKPLRWFVYQAIVGAFVSRIIIVEAIKRLVNHPRPYEVVSNIHQLLADSEHGNSFPSGHTVVFFSFAFAFYGTRLFWPFLAFAIIGSVARIFVGVHFPADIAGGFVAAALVSWGTRIFFNKYLTRLKNY